jgi:hypothetical protein
MIWLCEFVLDFAWGLWSITPSFSWTCFEGVSPFGEIMSIFGGSIFTFEEDVDVRLLYYL